MKRLNIFPFLVLACLVAATLIAVSYPLGSLLVVILVGAAIAFSVLSLKE